MKRSVALPAVLMLAAFMMTGCDIIFGPTKTDEPNQADPVAAQADIDAGIAFLQLDTPDFNAARTMFLSAVSNDPTSTTALMWSSLLNLAAISVDSSMASMMTTYFGVSGYPTSMNTLFTSKSWTMEVEDSYWDDWDGVEYLETYYLPTITIPASIKTYHDGIAGVTTMDEWRDSLVFNIMTRNSTGFNALSDAVTNLLDTGLSGVLSALESVPQNASITIPGSLFDEEAEDIVIGKAELQLEAAILYNVKASIHMGKAISLSLPLEDYYDAFNPIDNPGLYSEVTGPDFEAMIATLESLDTPFAAGFLMPRDTAVASLAAGKTATLAALSNLGSAMTVLAARTSTQAFTFRPDSFIFDEPDAPSWSAEVRPSLLFAKNLATRMHSAITNNSVLYMPVQNPEVYTDPLEYIAEFAIDANWPATSDLGIPANWAGTELDPGTDFPTAIGMRPAAAFETPLFAISNILDMDLATGEPKFYEATYDEEGNLESISSTAATLATVKDDPEVFYALKIKDLTINRSLVLTDTEYTAVKAALATALLDTGMIAASDLDILMSRSGTGAVSLYIPLVSGDLAANSLNGNSFWWSMPTLIMGMMMEPM